MNLVELVKLRKNLDGWSVRELFWLRNQFGAFIYRLREKYWAKYYDQCAERERKRGHDWSNFWRYGQNGEKIPVGCLAEAMRYHNELNYKQVDISSLEYIVQEKPSWEQCCILANIDKEKYKTRFITKVWKNHNADIFVGWYVISNPGGHGAKRLIVYFDGKLNPIRAYVENLKQRQIEKESFLVLDRDFDYTFNKSVPELTYDYDSDFFNYTYDLLKVYSTCIAWNDKCDDPRYFVNFGTWGSWGSFELKGTVKEDGRYELYQESAMGGGMMGQYGHTETESTRIFPTAKRALDAIVDKLPTLKETIKCHPKSITDCMIIIAKHYNCWECIRNLYGDEKSES